MGSLLLVTLLVWVAHYDRWTVESWKLPTDYTGDAPEILAQMKAASEGAMLPLQPKIVSRLGAPFGAQWNGYPTPDKHLMVFIGVLSRWIGLYAAANVALLLAVLSAAAAFYFVARWLRVRWEWAWCGALLFAFAYHTFHRGLGHFNLTFAWTVPLACLSVWLVAQSRRLEWRSAGTAVCLGTAVALGLHNPYNLFFWGQLMAWALVVQLLDQRRPVNIAIGATSLALAALVFIAANFEVWFHVQEPEGAPLLSRNYGGTEMYALKPMEMLLPPTFHRWGPLAFFAERYVRWSTWRGEVFLPYLGLVGIAAFLWLLAISVRRVLARQALPGQALSLFWLVAYATVGGVTNLLALVAGFQIFRATNRVAVFISAIVLAFFVVRMARLTIRWPAWARLGAAFGLALLGVLDQVPREASAAETQEIARMVHNDQQLARELEAALPHGAMVFQLPVLGFPEILPPYRLADYELFRPFLNTTSLRFSYGAAKFRARSRWQRDLENAPPEILVKRLEAYGFAALYINRKGYEDRAERLLERLRQLGYERRIEGASGDQVALLLHPSPSPVPPLGRSLTFGTGWLARLDNGVRWANARTAVLSYFNPYPHPLDAAVKLTFAADPDPDPDEDPEQITFTSTGGATRSVALGATTVTIDLPHLKLVPGVNVFHLTSSEPPTRHSSGRYQLRAFGLHSSSIRIRPQLTGAGLVARYDSD